jgi:hypothetical protein
MRANKSHIEFEKLGVETRELECTYIVDQIMFLSLDV